MQPVVKTIVMQIVPLKPLENHGAAIIHPATHGDPTQEQVDMHEEERTAEMN